MLPDSEAAAASLTDHVLGLGHRRLAIAAGPERLTTVADRTAGIRSAVAAHGLDPDDLFVVHAPFTREGGRDATQRILAQRPDIAKGIKQVVVMGGAHFNGGNITPAAEFNLYADPHAAEVVLASGVPLTYLPLAELMA